MLAVALIPIGIILAMALFLMVPLLIWDATASAVQGRYAVRFVGSPTPALIGGPGNGTIRPGRAIQAGIGLIEVA